MLHLLLGYLKKNRVIYSLAGLYLTFILLNSLGLKFWLPSCPFTSYFEVECFGCGINRALIALFRMQFEEAWSYNPLLFIYLPVAGSWISYDFYKYCGKNELFNQKHSYMSQFQKVIDEGYEFNMGKYLDEGWSIFKKDVGSFIGYTLIFFIISIVVGIIPIVSILGTFVQYALIGGAFIFIRNLLNGKQEFGDFFKGFNYFGQFLLYGLVLFLFFIPLIALVFAFIFPFEMLPEMFSGSDPQWIFEEMMYNIESGPMFFISLIIVVIASIYIYISYSLVIPLIADANLGFWDAMETSRKIVGKRFFHFLIFLILLGIIIMAATIFTCGLGLLVAVPFGIAVQFSLYDNIAKPQQDEITDQVASFGEENRDINTESDEDK